MVRFFIFISLALAFSACAPKHRNKPAASPKSLLEDTTPKSRGGIPYEDFHREPVKRCKNLYDYYESGKLSLRQEQPVTVNMVRTRQRTLYYDCAGNLRRDKMETVNSPHAAVKLRPSQDMDPVSAVRVFNPKTCDVGTNDLTISKSIVNKIMPLQKVTGLPNGVITLNGDASPAKLTFELRENEMNLVYYSYFTKCTKEEIVTTRFDGQFDVPACAGKAYHGIYQVYVNYTEEIIPGTREIRDTCDTKK